MQKRLSRVMMVSMRDSLHPVIRDDRVVINVSGMIFETREGTLARYPNTLLGCEDKREKFYVPEFHEYFFNRNRSAFEAILYYYQSNGRLQRPVDVPMRIFKQEIEFFELGEDVLNDIYLKEGYISVTDEEREHPENKIQRAIWELFDQPNTSMAATCLAIFSITIIALAIFVSIMETLPKDEPHTHGNTTNNHTKPTEVQKSTSPLKNTWFVMELSFNCWFTIEYLVRLVTAPNKCQFLTSLLNLIDLAAIAPFYVMFLLNKSQTGSVSVLRILRVVRVFRIFKLSRYSKSLQIIGYCVLESLRELGLLVLCLFFGVIVSASVLYYIELGQKDTDFISVPATFWFSLQTITTIGYGDMVPHSPWAKLTSAAIAIFGAVTLALPVLTFVSHFNSLYNKNVLEKIDEDQEDDISAAAKVDSTSNSQE